MSRDITSDNLHRQAEAARNLILSLASDDEELNHDMIEGETSFLEAIDAAIAEIDECDILIAGCKAKEAEIAERRKRAERRTERVRTLIEQAILTAEIRTVKVATATLTVKEVPPKYMVEDESKIPTKFWKQPDPVLDRAALGKAFKDGDAIPGVGQTNGGTSLQIRRT